MCTQTEIARRTLVQCAELQALDPKLLEPEHELKKDLGYDDAGLPYLAMALRSHIFYCGGEKSIYTTELRKKGMNIRKLVKLMIKRILDVTLTDGQANQRISAAKMQLP